MSLRSKLRTSGKRIAQHTRRVFKSNEFDGYEIVTDDPMWGLHGKTLRRKEPGENHSWHGNNASNTNAVGRLSTHRDSNGRLRVETRRWDR